MSLAFPAATASGLIMASVTSLATLVSSSTTMFSVLLAVVSFLAPASFYFCVRALSYYLLRSFSPHLSPSSRRSITEAGELRAGLLGRPSPRSQAAGPDTLDTRRDSGSPDGLALLQAPPSSLHRSCFQACSQRTPSLENSEPPPPHLPSQCKSGLSRSGTGQTHRARHFQMHALISFGKIQRQKEISYTKRE